MLDPYSSALAFDGWTLPTRGTPDLPTSRDGALSCLTGIAARKSLDEKRLVRIDELVPGL